MARTYTPDLSDLERFILCLAQHRESKEALGRVLYLDSRDVQMACKGVHSAGTINSAFWSLDAKGYGQTHMGRKTKRSANRPLFRTNPQRARLACARQT